MKVEADTWLAEIFRQEVFRVSPGPTGDDVAAVQAHLQRREGRDAVYYTKLPTARVDQVKALTKLGFSIVDVNLTFERDAAVPAEPPSVPIREARPADHPRLLEIAESCFVYSRFHLDPLVPNHVANAIKRAWVENYLLGRRGECVRVAEDAGQPVGFLAVLPATCRGRSARVIDLVGVDRRTQGRGVGKSLVADFVGSCPQACELLRVGTQAANIPSIRLYEGSGFRLADSAYVLHAHVKGGHILQ
jgi:ribosomal protein S18 acetylase RimI-like enzyme